MAAERELARRIGRELTDVCMEATSQYSMPLPIGGYPFYSVEGIIYPRMAGAALADLAAYRAAPAQEIFYNWMGTSSNGQFSDSWDNSPTAGSVPGQGAASAAVPGGTVPTRATTGALGQRDATAGTLYLSDTNLFPSATSTGFGIWILYDRLFAAQLSTTSTASQAVTGVPTRYTGTEAKGNCFWVVTRTTYTTPAAHTWTVTYTDQDGNAGASSGAVTGYASASATGRIDTAAGSIWHYPFAAGDLGVRAVTAVQLSASQAGGSANVVIGRPLQMVPIWPGVASDHYNSVSQGFNLVAIKAGAALSHLFFSPGNASMTVGGSYGFVEG